jgi:hypothetical protein
MQLEWLVCAAKITCVQPKSQLIWDGGASWKLNSASDRTFFMKVCQCFPLRSHLPSDFYSIEAVDAMSSCNYPELSQAEVFVRPKCWSP